MSSAHVERPGPDEMSHALDVALDQPAERAPGGIDGIDVTDEEHARPPGRGRATAPRDDPPGERIDLEPEIRERRTERRRHPIEPRVVPRPARGLDERAKPSLHGRDHVGAREVGRDRGGVVRPSGRGRVSHQVPFPRAASRPHRPET
jgi:hypothetical protein